MASLPDNADLVVIGTGVVEALVACAAALHGRKVLILDDEQHYGGLGATLNLSSFWNWYARHAALAEKESAESQGHVASSLKGRGDSTAAMCNMPAPTVQAPASNSSRAAATSVNTADGGERVAHETLPQASLDEAFTGVLRLCRHAQEITHLNAHMQAARVPGRDNDYCVDLAHQALECTGSAIEAIRKAGLHRYIEFMPVADAFLYDARDRRLVPVPGSIAGVHGMQGLSMEDRRRLWLFMRQVERAATGAPTSLFEGRHFLADLQHCHLPDFVQDAIVYAVIGCEEPVNEQTKLLGQKALSAIGRYVSQTGTYIDNQAPYIEPCHGSSEIAQAAIRSCCVHGGIAALDCRLDALLLADTAVTGVRMQDGHVVRCSQVVVTQSLLAAASLQPVQVGIDSASHIASSAEQPQSASPSPQRVPQPVQTAAERETRRVCSMHASVELLPGRMEPASAARQHQPANSSDREQLEERDEGVARGVVMLSGSLLDEVANARITIPPRACGNAHTVNVWQCHSSLRVCPEQHSLLYLSTRHSEAGTTAAQILAPCVEALLKAVSTASGRQRGRSRDDGGTQQQLEGPSGLEVCVECFYVQRASLSEGQSYAGLHRASPPTAAATLDGAADEAQRIFEKLYPGLEFLCTPEQHAAEAEPHSQRPGPAEPEAFSGGADENDSLEAALLALGVE